MVQIVLDNLMTLLQLGRIPEITLSFNGSPCPGNRCFVVIICCICYHYDSPCAQLNAERRVRTRSGDAKSGVAPVGGNAARSRDKTPEQVL